MTAFPSGVRTIPVEATESVAPVIFRRREFREGSGGAGRQRGGLGQVIELGGIDGTPIAMLCNFERISNPARGRDGGGLGAPGRVSLLSRASRSGAKGRQTVAGGDFIRLELPGGGGFGDPAERDPEQVAADVADGLYHARGGRARLPRRPDQGGRGRPHAHRAAATGASWRITAAARSPCRRGMRVAHDLRRADRVRLARHTAREGSAQCSTAGFRPIATST